ncbi:MAG: hypothetical protein EHM63_02155 [Actinobacteria bacterium]|nr:MAG: hypothetical protein EHM63_02155 [Actinomycetota bacterium]
MTIQDESDARVGIEASEDSAMPARVPQTARTEASEVVSTATDGAREVTSEVAEQAKAVVIDARDQVQELMTRAREEVRGQAQQRNDQAATQLRSLSQQLTALADGRPESAGHLVGVLESAEGQVERLATRLEQRGPQGLMDDVTHFARRRPAMFLSGAVAAGFVVGRVLRAGVATPQPDGERPQESTLTRGIPS